jgi:hypothetical protein
MALQLDLNGILLVISPQGVEVSLHVVDLLQLIVELIVLVLPGLDCHVCAPKGILEVHLNIIKNLTYDLLILKVVLLVHLELL